MPFIGKQSSANSQITNYTTTVGSGGQTNFTVVIDGGDETHVYLNGVLLKETTDYTVSSTQVSLVSAAAENDVVEIKVYRSFAVVDAVKTTGGTFTGTVSHTGTLNVSGGTLTTSTAQKTTIVDGGKGNLAKGDVGLGNVDNESKDTMFASPTFTGTVAGVTKSHVGLSNVTNDAQVPASGGTFSGNITIPDGTASGHAVTKSQLDNISVTPTAVSDQANTSTGYLDIPAGTTAQRPGTPNAGNLRFNSDEESLEFYTGTAWAKTNEPTPTITSISGTIYAGVSGNLTITGTDFNTSNISIEWLDGATQIAKENDITPTSATSVTRTIPASVYGKASGTTIGIRVLNAGSVASNTDTSKSVIAVPTGGTLDTTSVSGYRIHTFTSASTPFYNTAINNLSVEYLIVAGGGGGGGSSNGNDGGGGGGAGGMLTGTTTVSSQSSAYTITVGGGGTGGTGANSGTDGSPSSVFSISTSGGGGGATQNTVGRSGGSGSGAGGGGSVSVRAGGSGTSGQGNDGGDSTDPRPTWGLAGGGGGGKGSAGGDFTGASTAGVGGDGETSSITGTSTLYAAGGGGGGGIGGSNTTNGASGGNSGQIGGDGGNSQSNGANGNANKGTGGGGGGCTNGGANTSGGNGGDGIVIIRYQLP